MRSRGFILKSLFALSLLAIFFTVRGQSLVSVGVKPFRTYGKLTFLEAMNSNFLFSSPLYTSQLSEDDDDFLTTVFGPSPCKRVTEKLLAEEGPQFPETFNSSNFSIQGFVKDGWILRIAGQLEEGATATVTVTTKNSAPFIHRFTATKDHVEEKIKVRLQNDTSRAVPGMISFQAIKTSVTNEIRLAKFEMPVISAGPETIGDREIILKKFTPAEIYPIRNQPVEYEFTVDADRYNHARAEFRAKKCAAQAACDWVPIGVKEDFKNKKLAAYAGMWNGKVKKGRISVGDHQLFASAWQDTSRIWVARTVAGLRVLK